MLTIEIDNMKDPLTDMIQDIDRQRVGVMMELERTQRNNRELVKTTQKLGKVAASA